MKNRPQYRVHLTPEQRKRRQTILGATIISCISAAMIFGAAHVVKLGSNRMDDMRSKAGYDLKDEASHIRAAGEDIELHKLHEMKKKLDESYELVEVETLIAPEKWLEIDQLVKIPSGEFLMGTDYTRADLQDQPQHKVTTPEYYIDKYPVTNIQYARFVSKSKHRPPLDWVNGKIPDDKNLHPVVMVSWYDAKAYCKSMGKRLPTEQEWEKAASGNKAWRWPWGNKMDPSRLNTYYNIGSSTDVMRFTQGASPYGVMDMAGNVSEWTDSDLAPYKGSSAPSSLFQAKTVVASTAKDRAMKVADLVALEKGTYKVRRGGSWKSDPFATSTYHRNFSLPHYASDFFGFRCAKDIGTPVN